MSDVARRFWSAQTAYPAYPHIKRRRWYELAYLVPRIQGASSLADLGAGDGALIRCLRELTDIRHFAAVELSPGLASHIDEDVEVVVGDLRDVTIPEADVSIMAGVLPCLMDDTEAVAVLERAASPLLFVRSTCSLDRSYSVDDHNSALGARYAASYRSIDHVEELIGSAGWDVLERVRVYPDDIESEFGTKQFYWSCRR